MSKAKYFVYTDASFSHLDSLGVSGFSVFESETTHEQGAMTRAGIRTHFFKESNNIRAEIIGALWALNTIAEESKNSGSGKLSDKLEINLFSDCQTLTNLLARRGKLIATDYISKRKNLPLVNTDLYKDFFIVYDELQPIIHWVNGHTKKENQTAIQKNFEMVDKQVRKELRTMVKNIKK